MDRLANMYARTQAIYEDASLYGHTLTRTANTLEKMAWAPLSWQDDPFWTNRMQRGSYYEQGSERASAVALATAIGMSVIPGIVELRAVRRIITQPAILSIAGFSAIIDLPTGQEEWGCSLRGGLTVRLTELLMRRIGFSILSDIIGGLGFAIKVVDQLYESP